MKSWVVSQYATLQSVLQCVRSIHIRKESFFNILKFDGVVLSICQFLIGLILHPCIVVAAVKLVHYSECKYTTRQIHTCTYECI